VASEPEVVPQPDALVDEERSVEVRGAVASGWSQRDDGYGRESAEERRQRDFSADDCARTCCHQLHAGRNPTLRGR
jgi:hypothetical protein